jgi:hypothetical protein
VWDGAAKALFTQVADSAGELRVTDRADYWAQGGISMSLADDVGWQAQAEAEHMPGMDEIHMRSAALYDTANRLWLVVTPTLCTAEQFRDAVKEKGGDLLQEGIFLDGDGSSQMRARGIRLPGDNREVRQVMALIR